MKDFTPYSESAMPNEEKPWNRKAEPTIEATDRAGGTVERHPAYALIRAGRVGGTTALFQSDFRHDGYIKLTVSGAHVERNLSNDWVHPDNLHGLIEIELSEAQWASFVSSMNVGMGTPCTLRHVNGDYVPGILAPKQRHAQFKHESAAAMQQASEGLEALAATIKSMGLPKAKERALLGGVEAAARGVGSSQTFIAEQFSEHIERTVEAAKAEVAGYVSGAVRQLGLQALAASSNSDVKPLKLGFPGDQS